MEMYFMTRSAIASFWMIHIENWGLVGKYQIVHVLKALLSTMSEMNWYCSKITYNNVHTYVELLFELYVLERHIAVCTQNHAPFSFM